MLSTRIDMDDGNTRKNLRLLFLLLFGLLFIKGQNGVRYKICKNNVGKYVKPNCESIFIWNGERANFMSLFNVTLLNNNNTYSNPKALHGRTVRVIADNMLPYITSSNYSQTLGGFLGDIWNLIEDHLEFKSNVSSVFYDTGLNIIMSGDADVMLAAGVLKDGLLNVKYSQPYFYNWYHLFTKMPIARASSSSYLKTFDIQLWLASLIVFTILTVAVWFTINFLNTVCKIERRLSIPSCYLGMVSGFINQGFDLRLSSYSGRMQVMFALVLGVVLYSAMNAVLVAQLAVFDIPFPFKSLDDIVQKRTHSLCLRSNSFVYNNFTINKEIMPKWKGILNTPQCLDINNQTNLVNILCRENLIILENRAVMEIIQKNNKLPCQLLADPKKLYKQGNSMLLMKGFEGKRLVDGMVKKMRSTGILQRLEYKWIRREKLVNINIAQSPQVTLDHIQGLLVMYSASVLISLGLLAAEISYFRYFHEHTYSRKFIY